MARYAFGSGTAATNKAARLAFAATRKARPRHLCAPAFNIIVDQALEPVLVVCSCGAAC